MTYKTVGEVRFPKFTGANVNMMPFIMGDKETLPKELHQYWDMISQCDLPSGDTVYLTVTESLVDPLKHQRRPGIHTDGVSNNRGWGGGNWGGPGGIFIASTDGNTILFNCETHDVDDHGKLNEWPEAPPELAKPNTLYHMSDRTPHMNRANQGKLPMVRQFFRLVAKDIYGWWEQHSTKNPLGILPNAPILTHSKF